jgi:hypothetical protein
MIARWFHGPLRVLLLAAGLASNALAAGEGPRLPCGAAPYPPYAEPGAPPNVRAWSGKAAQSWAPPPCIGWAPQEADMLVALAGSFRLEGDLDAVLARIGAISAKKGVRYWSTTEKEWKPLVTDAFALGSPDPASRRADFAPAQWTAGQSLYYAQADNRTAGVIVYRDLVRSAERERIVVESENLTPMKKMMITLFDPGGMQTVYFIERRAPGEWNFYSLTRTRMASVLLPTGGEGSYINRSAAFYRYVAGIPTDQEPPPAR